MQRLRRPRFAAGIVLGIAAVVAVGAWVFGLLSTDAARPAPPGSALARFRGLDVHPATLDGVYTYRTRGGESIDVLGGSSHRYPAETTITLVRVPCGVELRWDALAHRSTTWTFCTAGGRVAVHAVDQVHTFFATRDETSYVCAPHGAAFSCRSAHAAASGRVAVLGTTTLEVAGVRTPALHVRMTATVSGGSRGVERTDWWFEPKLWLPLRIELSNRTSRAEPLVGTAHYREDATLQLVSTTPER